MLQLFAESCHNSSLACFKRSEKTVPGHLEVNWDLVLVLVFFLSSKRMSCPYCSVLTFLMVHVLVCVCEINV